MKNSQKTVNTFFLKSLTENFQNDKLRALRYFTAWWRAKINFNKSRDQRTINTFWSQIFIFSKTIDWTWMIELDFKRLGIPKLEWHMLQHKHSAIHLMIRIEQFWQHWDSSQQLQLEVLLCRLSKRYQHHLKNPNRINLPSPHPWWRLFSLIHIFAARSARRADLFYLDGLYYIDNSWKIDISKPSDLKFKLWMFWTVYELIRYCLYTSRIK